MVDEFTKKKLERNLIFWNESQCRWEARREDGSIMCWVTAEFAIYHKAFDFDSIRRLMLAVIWNDSNMIR